MGANTKIEWTDATWNPIRAVDLKSGKVGWHCEHATTGCINCYAEGMNKRLGTGLAFKPGHRSHVNIFLDEEMLRAPLRWKKPRMIFVCSMTDAFGSFVKDEWLDKMFAVMALCPQHTFQVLTKRPERMREYCASKPPNLSTEVLLMAKQDEHGYPIAGPCIWPLPNVWLGVSAERQEEADERIPHLLQTPAALRFVSAEPLLGPIDLDGTVRRARLAASVTKIPSMNIDWVIVGGESGADARGTWVPDIRSIVKQCRRAGAPVFVKQMGSNVRDRNDAGFEGCDPSEWPLQDQGQIDFEPDGYADEAQGAPCRIRLKNRKGGDWNEWPEDLRVREFPKVSA